MRDTNIAHILNHFPLFHFTAYSKPYTDLKNTPMRFPDLKHKTCNICNKTTINKRKPWCLLWQHEKVVLCVEYKRPDTNSQCHLFLSSYQDVLSVTNRKWYMYLEQYEKTYRRKKWSDIPHPYPISRCLISIETIRVKTRHKIIHNWNLDIIRPCNSKDYICVLNIIRL